MKNSRTFRMCQMIAVLSAALLAFSCEKPDTPEPPQNEQEVPGTSDGKEEQTFSITAPESEFYQIDVPQTAKEGETFPYRIIKRSISIPTVAPKRITPSQPSRFFKRFLLSVFTVPNCICPSEIDKGSSQKQTFPQKASFPTSIARSISASISLLDSLQPM